MSFQDVPDDASLADPLPAAPFDLLSQWFDQARENSVVPNPTAMAVATVDANGQPSARMLLCRAMEPAPGYVVFYTNRRSRKGRELTDGAYAAAVFHWDTLRRQVRIEGPVLHSPDTESDEYFTTRPRPSQIAAWASDQSQAIALRSDLLDKLKQYEEQFEGKPVPRPSHWGGYRLYCERVELWVGAEGRAHDRVLWDRTLTREGIGFTGSPWRSTRLQP